MDIKRIFGLLLIALLTACDDAFEYSPNQVFDRDSGVGLNEMNLGRLQSRPGDDTVTVAFVGDSQRFYDELEAFIEKINGISGVDFVLLAGDISDFGLLEEFEMVNDRLARLEVPYFGIVGNHDVVSRGAEVFQRMFGPLNFSFAYRGVKFVAHNTNSKEFRDGNVPDMEWLRKELVRSDSARFFVAVSHVPPFSEDFDRNLEDGYASLFRETPGFLISLHGHIHAHKDGSPYSDGMRYMTSYSFDQRSFVLLKIHSGIIEKRVVDY